MHRNVGRKKEIVGTVGQWTMRESSAPCVPITIAISCVAPLSLSALLFSDGIRVPRRGGGVCVGVNTEYYTHGQYAKRASNYRTFHESNGNTCPIIHSKLLSVQSTLYKCYTYKC